MSKTSDKMMQLTDYLDQKTKLITKQFGLKNKYFILRKISKHEKSV